MIRLPTGAGTGRQRITVSLGLGGGELVTGDTSCGPRGMRCVNRAEPRNTSPSAPVPRNL